MLGDIAPLKEMVAVAKKYGAMVLVDEAHSMGFFGPNGRGVYEAQGLDVDFVVCSELETALPLLKERLKLLLLLKNKKDSYKKELRLKLKPSRSNQELTRSGHLPLEDNTTGSLNSPLRNIRNSYHTWLVGCAFLVGRQVSHPSLSLPEDKSRGL